jgi:hypothetical protein
MSSKYFSVEFTGAYQGIVNYFNTKDWNYEIKNVGGSKLFLKVSEDLAEEVKYCNDMTIDDVKGDKITNIKEISQSEFQNFSENGFEIIHDHQQLETPLLTKEPFEIKKEVVNKLPELIFEKIPEKSIEQISDNIARALNDTILPSKSPLPQDDSFSYLTSKNYLRNFLAVSTVILFLIALFD